MTGDTGAVSSEASQETAPQPLRSVGPPPEGDDLAGLLRASARGDEAAFAQVYDRTAARVYGLALRVVRDRAMSEEVTQDAYLEAWRHAARFDPAKGSAMGWLLTLTHRKAVDKVRSSEASRARENAHAHQNQPVPYDVTAEAATASLEAKRVRSALDTLTDTQRTAVELAFLSGYTHTEVATLLDLPLGTAKTRIRDGPIPLRDVLGASS